MIFFRFFFILALAFFMGQPMAGAQMGKPMPFHLKQKKGAKLSPKTLSIQVEQALFDQTNVYREKKKRKPLTFNKNLRKAALDHSADMMKRKYLSHISPERKTPVDRLGQYAKVKTHVGENIHTIKSSRGLSDPQGIAAQMIADWKGSPSHRKNLLGKQFTQLGVGCVSDGLQIYCTQVFSGPNLKP